jgi:pilus assembly protein Flp/PilA
LGEKIQICEEKPTMNNALLKMYIKFQDLMNREDGQDLVEYALVIAIVAIGAVTVLPALSTKINSVFTTITNDL